MKNILKSRKIIGIVLVALLLFTTSVYAVNNDSYKTTIATANTEVKRGDTVIVTIGLDDIKIESGEKGIGAYTAKVESDPNVLEYVKTDGTDKWEAPFYQNGLITGHTRDGEVVNTNGSIGTITFKVKSDAKLGESIISLINFSGSTAVTDVDANNVPVTRITIIDNNNGNGNGNDNDNPNGGNNNDNPNGGNGSSGSNSSNGGSSNGNSSSNNKDNTIKQDKLPKTGEADIVVYIAIASGAVLATIFFVKMKKFNI